MDPEDYGLLDYEIEELVPKLPKISKDLNLLWKLLLKAYGQECFTPMIVMKFPNQFKMDLEKSATQLKTLKTSIMKETQGIVGIVDASLKDLRIKNDDLKHDLKDKEVDSVMIKERLVIAESTLQ